MTIRITYTLAPGAHAPTRATAGAAGMDLHAYLPDGASIRIPPGEWRRIRTGVYLALPPGFEGQIRPRSGLAWKRGITVLNSPGTIDSDYRGELGVILINHGVAHDFVHDGDRIAQLVVCPVPAVQMVPANSLPATARGAGGFGSTGTGPVDSDDRARLEARVRALEAECAEARAEAAQWAAKLDEERAAVVAYLRKSAAVADEFGAVPFAIAEEAEAIERGEHRAVGAR